MTEEEIACHRGNRGSHKTNRKASLGFGDLGKCGFNEVVERSIIFQCFRSELENQMGDIQS